MRYIHKFEDAYKTLEHTLRRVTGISNQPIIPLFIEILPPSLAAQMETIRKFRNDFPGHGVSVGGKSPQAPDTFVSFLNQQIIWVDKHGDKVKKGICTRRQSSKKTEHSRSVGAMGSNALRVKRIISSHNNEVDPKRKKLKRLVMKALSGWSKSEKESILSTYEYSRKRFQSLDDALADAMLVNMTDHEFEQLLSTVI